MAVVGGGGCSLRRCALEDTANLQHTHISNQSTKQAIHTIVAATSRLRFASSIPIRLFARRSSSSLHLSLCRASARSMAPTLVMLLLDRSRLSTVPLCARPSAISSTPARINGMHAVKMASTNTAQHVQEDVVSVSIRVRGGKKEGDQDQSFTELAELTNATRSQHNQRSPSSVMPLSLRDTILMRLSRCRKAPIAAQPAGTR